MPELPLGPTCKWHLFLSHIWSTGQDQNATIKRQLCLLLPGVSIFLDVDDLESIDALEEYIDGSQVISLFCSKGYYQSRNCLREVRSTLEKKKPFYLVHDSEKGGATLEAIKDDECPAELRGPVFADRRVIAWYRIADFQKVLLAGPNFIGQEAVSLFIPNELTTKRWAFEPAITVYCSPNNPGAAEAVQGLGSTLADALTGGGSTSARGAAVGLNISTTLKGAPSPPSHFVLYLSKQTWLGDAGDLLAEEVRHARVAGLPIVMVHEKDMRGDTAC